MKVTAVLITTAKTYPEVIDFKDFDEVIIKTESPSVYQRYLEAAKAKNDVIYFQDDDCLLDYKALYQAYDGRLTNYMTAAHQDSYRRTGATLVGWGCFFPKKMLSCFDRYIAKYGVDAHLLRDADRIFTVLNQPHTTIIGDHKDLETARDGTRMWQEGNHWTSMEEAIAKAWTLL